MYLRGARHCSMEHGAAPMLNNGNLSEPRDGLGSCKRRIVPVRRQMRENMCRQGPTPVIRMEAMTDRWRRNCPGNSTRGEKAITRFFARRRSGGRHFESCMHRQRATPNARHRLQASKWQGVRCTRVHSTVTKKKQQPANKLYKRMLPLIGETLRCNAFCRFGGGLSSGSAETQWRRVRETQ